MNRWPRLRWGDGFVLDLPDPVPDLLREEWEKPWRAVHIRVEWLKSPRGRLDHLLPADVLRKR